MTALVLPANISAATPGVTAHDSLADAVAAPDFRVAAPPAGVTRALDAVSQNAPLAAAAHLESEPLVAGAVERLLRSPSYGCEGDDLARVLDNAGPRAARHAILEASLGSSVFRAPGFTDLVVRARAHASAVAHAANAVAIVAGLPAADVDAAFLLGLFHDAGIGAALAHVAAHPEQFGRPRASVLASMVGQVHEEAGERVARVWRVPPRVCALVKRHHQALDRDPLLAVLLVAEHAANEQGFAVDVAPSTGGYDPSSLAVDAGLGALALHRAHRQLGRDVDAALRAVRGSL